MFAIPTAKALMVPADTGESSAHAAVNGEASCLRKCQNDQADAETSVILFAAVKLHTEVLPTGRRSQSCYYSSFVCCRLSDGHS